MYWKIFFHARAENGMPASKHYKLETSSPAHAFSHAINYVERHYKVHLIEIEDASAKLITRDEWDDDSDGYEQLH